MSNTERNNDEEIERAYRSGYSHGYETGTCTKCEAFQVVGDKIREWKYDLFNLSSAPGTKFENIKMSGFVPQQGPSDEEMNDFIKETRKKGACVRDS